MAILLKRVFERSVKDAWYGWRLRGSQDDEALCDKGFRALFTVPRKTTRVWVSLHDHPTKDRHEAEIRHEGGDGYGVYVLTRDKVVDWGCCSMDKILKKLTGKSSVRIIFVEVEYEE